MSRKQSLSKAIPKDKMSAVTGERMIRLESRGGEDVGMVLERDAVLSETIIMRLSAMQAQAHSNGNIVIRFDDQSPQRNVDGKVEMVSVIARGTLAPVIEWLQHHAGVQPPAIPKPLRSRDPHAFCADPWDAAFVERMGGNGSPESRQLLYSTITAAYFLRIKGLTELLCAYVASLFKGHSLEAIPGILKGTPAPMQDDSK
jgi:hypothetical protein